MNCDCCNDTAVLRCNLNKTLFKGAEEELETGIRYIEKDLDYLFPEEFSSVTLMVHGVPIMFFLNDDGKLDVEFENDQVSTAIQVFAEYLKRCFNG